MSGGMTEPIEPARPLTLADLPQLLEQLVQLQPDPLQLLTFADLARLWGTGEDWIRRGVSARRFPFTHAGREIRFTRDQAAAILAARAVEPAHVPTRDQVAATRARAARPTRTRRKAA